MRRSVRKTTGPAILAILAMCGLALCALAATGCSRSKGQEAAGKPPVAVETQAAAADTLRESVPVTGSLAPKRQAEVRSEITGTVASVVVAEWVPVRKGDVLARLDPRETAAALEGAKAEAARAAAANARAERELQRCERLRTAGLATQQTLDDARTESEAAAAALQAAQAQLDYAKSRHDKSVLRAPIDGAVAYRGVNVGDYVENMGAPPLFRIVDNSLLDLTVTVPAGRSSAVQPGQRLTFTTEAVPDRRFAGVVAHVNPAFDEASRTLKVIAEVPNPDGALRGGLFVTGAIEIGERAGVLLLPREALVGWDVAAGRAELFVVQGETAHQRAVRTGAAAAGRVEIIEGLAAGDRVVVRGAYNLRDGDRVRDAGSAEE